MGRVVWFALAIALAVTVNAAPALAKTDIIVIPASYHAKAQPPVAVQSFMLTLMQQGGNWDDKYRHVVEVLAKDQRLMANIKKAAKIYDVDPVNIIGAHRRRTHLQHERLRFAAGLLREGPAIHEQQVADLLLSGRACLGFLQAAAICRLARR